MNAVLDEATALVADPALVPPLVGALVTAAATVLAENPHTPGHAHRARLAGRVLRQVHELVDPFAWAVASCPATLRKWHGEDRALAHVALLSALASIWNAEACVEP